MKKKIFFFIPSLRGGGAERVLSILLNHINSSSFDPYLVLLQKEGAYLNSIPEHIPILDLQASRVRYAIFKIVRFIFHSKPDLVFSTLGHLNLLIALLRPFLPRKIKFIARESNIISEKLKNMQLSWLFQLLYRYSYNRFDRIICQSRDMQNDLIANFNVKQEKTLLIYNPVDCDKIREESTKDSLNITHKKAKKILAVGRLHYQKGFDLLLQSLAMVKENIHLTILGEGGEKGNLINLCSELDLKGSVTFAGFQKNPYAYMASSDLFVLSSRFEGFPNAVLEAMTTGTPVVAFECPGGLTEIIKSGLNGLLVQNGDILDLSKKIELALQMQWDRDKIIESVCSRYSIDVIVQKYEAVFDS